MGVGLCLDPKDAKKRLITSLDRAPGLMTSLCQCENADVHDVPSQARLWVSKVQPWLGRPSHFAVGLGPKVACRIIPSLLNSCSNCSVALAYYWSGIITLFFGTLKQIQVSSHRLHTPKISMIMWFELVKLYMCIYPILCVFQFRLSSLKPHCDWIHHWMWLRSFRNIFGISPWIYQSHYIPIISPLDHL